MDFLTVPILGIERDLWFEIKSSEKMRYNFIAIVLAGFALISLISMYYIGISIFGNRLTGIFIALFFTFLFYNIYRFAIISTSFVLGKEKSNLQPELTDEKATVSFKQKLARFKPKFSFSTIVKMVVMVILGCIVNFGWNIALNFSDVSEFNATHYTENSVSPVNSQTFHLSATAEYLAAQTSYKFWLTVICGALLYAMRLKKRLVTKKEYEYFQKAKERFESLVQSDYLNLKNVATDFFTENRIQYKFDSIWKNPPYKTEYIMEFPKRENIDLVTLLKGK